MSSALGAILHRDRRRLVFVAALAYLAGFLFYLPTGVYLGGVHISLLTGLVYAVVVGGTAFLICAVFPAMRFMIEAVAVARLALSVFVLAAPHIGFAILSSPLLTAILVVLGGALVSRVMHGRILRDRLPGWRGFLLPGAAFQRVPVRITGHEWQHRYVHWIDGTRAHTG